MLFRSQVHSWKSPGFPIQFHAAHKPFRQTFSLTKNIGEHWELLPHHINIPSIQEDQILQEPDLCDLVGVDQAQALGLQGQEFLLLLGSAFVGPLRLSRCHHTDVYMFALVHLKEKEWGQHITNCKKERL